MTNFFELMLFFDLHIKDYVDSIVFQEI